MKTGQFREDLYYRINTITVNLPPLRERREDMPLLAEHFLRARTPTYGRKRLAEPRWPRSSATPGPATCASCSTRSSAARDLCKGDEITPADLPPEVAGGAVAAATAPGSAGGGNTLETMERQHIIGTLRQVAGHRGKAAAAARHRSQDALPEDPQLPDHAHGAHLSAY